MKTVTVSQINVYIQDLIQDNVHLQHVSVEGEISNLKYHTSGHIYFTLKDQHKGEKYLWMAERLVDGRILLLSSHSPIASKVSAACYQNYLEQLTHIHTNTIQF